MQSRQENNMTLVQKLDVNYKQEICEVFELAAIHGLYAHFLEGPRDGPIHSATFHFQLTVGKFVGEGFGPTKIEAKTAAAAEVLPQLKLLETPKKRDEGRKKRKVWNDAPKFNGEANPITCLNDLVFHMRAKLPEYIIVHVDKSPETWIFHMQLKVADETVTGRGFSKKEAKRNAAAFMMNRFGYDFPVKDDYALPEVTDEEEILQNVNVPESSNELPQETESSFVQEVTQELPTEPEEQQITEASLHIQDSSSDASEEEMIDAPECGPADSTESSQSLPEEQEEHLVQPFVDSPPVCPELGPLVESLEDVEIHTEIHTSSMETETVETKTTAQTTAVEQTSDESDSICEEQKPNLPEMTPASSENSSPPVLLLDPAVTFTLTENLVREILKMNKLHNHNECSAIAKRLEENIRERLTVDSDTNFSSKKSKRIAKSAAKYLKKRYSSVAKLLEVARDPEDSDFENAVVMFLNVELRILQTKAKSREAQSSTNSGSPVRRFFSGLRRFFRTSP